MADHEPMLFAGGDQDLLEVLAEPTDRAAHRRVPLVGEEFVEDLTEAPFDVGHLVRRRRSGSRFGVRCRGGSSRVPSCRRGGIVGRRRRMQLQTILNNFICEVVPNLLSTKRL